MLGHAPFYHQTIRKYVTLFGSLFNDIFIVRETYAGAKKERIKVPLSYSSKEKFITRLKSDPTLTKSIQTTLPRMCFEMLSLQYDESRKQQSTIRHRTTSLTTPTAALSQYIGVPYNFDFSLGLYVRNIEDGLQVVEQILPFFLPDYTISASLSTELNIIKDIPIVLTSVAENNQYDGIFEEGTRMVTWDFQFTMKGYIFGPTSTSSVIMGVSANTADPNAAITGGIHTNIYTDINNKPIQKITVTGGTIDYIQHERIREPETGIVGYVYAWYPNTNTLFVSSASGVLFANANIWGLESGAHWKALSLENTNQKQVDIWIYQNPITANANSDYGYTTHIDEFPNIT